MCKSLFEILKYNRCVIKLRKSEQKFLYENLKESIEQKNVCLLNVNSSIKNLLESSSIRYFSEIFIDQISKDLFERIEKSYKDINEGGARDYNGSGKTEADIVKRKLNIDTANGMYVVYIDNKPIMFKDEDTAVLYCRNNFDIID